MAMGWDDALILGTLAVGSAAASAGINSAVGSATSTHIARKTAKYNLRNAMATMAAQDEYQRAYSKDMSAWQAAYGPSMKMAGLEAAGLNPILAYDSVSGSLPTASYNGAGAGTSAGPTGNANVDLLGSVGSAFELKNKAAEASRAEDIVDSDIGLKRSQADSLDASREKAAADIGVQNANADKIREETAGIKLNNDLKAAQNARDIARAKSDYENETGELEKNKALGGKPFVEHNGSIGIRPFTPYERKAMETIENEKYLNTKERSIMMDAVNGAQGVTSAAGSLFGKSNGVFRKATPAVHNHFH